MEVHYAVMAATGINDPSGTLTSALDDPTVCDTFGEAKSEVISRADAVLEYLVATERHYAMHVESREEHFEVRFEYGPASPDPTLPFAMVLQVHRCTAAHGPVEPPSRASATAALAHGRSPACPHAGRDVTKHSGLSRLSSVRLTAGHDTHPPSGRPRLAAGGSGRGVHDPTPSTTGEEERET